MLGAAVPPIGIVFARLAMLPPLNSDLFATVWRQPIALANEAIGHTSTDVAFPSSLPHLATPVWVASRDFRGGRVLERPRSYTGRRWLSRNDLARNWKIRRYTASAICCAIA